MNTLLLIFFALPIAVIIISIALQLIFRNSFLVAAIIFAIFLVVTFVIGDLNWLIATIAYTILAFITAILTKIISRVLRQMNNGNNNNNPCENSNTDESNLVNGTQILSIEGQKINDDNLSYYPEYNATGRTRYYCNRYRR